MPKIDDFKFETRIFALHLGESKSGKSSAAASYPGPYHDIDIDMRFGGIAGAVKKGLIEGKGITYEQFTPFSGWEPIDKSLQQLNVYRIQAGNNTSAFPYGTVGLGSISSLSRTLHNFAQKELKGRMVGTMRLPVPGDQIVVNNGIHTFLDYLKMMPCNIIVTGHIIDRWGKDPNADSEYSPRVVIGSKLNLNDQLSSTIVSLFDNVFVFDKSVVGVSEKYTVEFSSELAGNTFGIPPGKHDITGVKFYPYLMQQIAKYNK